MSVIITAGEDTLVSSVIVCHESAMAKVKVRLSEVVLDWSRGY